MVQSGRPQRQANLVRRRTIGPPAELWQPNSRPQMQAPVHIAFAMTGDIHRNSRGLRQIAALTEAGYRVSLFTLPGSDIHSELPSLVDHHILSVPGSGGPSFFLRVHRTFSGALAATSARLFHASDLYVLPACRRAARKGGARLSYDARELYPHVSATVGRPHVSAFWKMVERPGIRAADRVWTVSDPIADHLAAEYGIARPTVQLNAPPVSAPQASSWLRKAAGLPGTARIVLHLGQLRKDRGGDLLIDAMDRVAAAPGGPDVHLVFLGYGPEQARLRDRVRTWGLEEAVHFLDAIPPSRLTEAASGAHAGVTLLEPSCLNHRLALPNKLFDYLSAGLAVVASDLPAIARIVGDYECGILTDPYDSQSLAQALVRAASDSAESGRWRAQARRAAETFDWKMVSQRYLEQIHTLIGPP